MSSSVSVTAAAAPVLAAWNIPASFADTPSNTVSGANADFLLAAISAARWIQSAERQDAHGVFWLPEPDHPEKTRTVSAPNAIGVLWLSFMRHFRWPSAGATNICMFFRSVVGSLATRPARSSWRWRHLHSRSTKPFTSTTIYASRGRLTAGLNPRSLVIDVQVIAVSPACWMARWTRSD